MRMSDFAYPAVNLVHLAGLVLLVGSMLILDLRLLGVARRLPLTEVSSLLTPLAVVGLVLLLLSGVLLFSADAGPLLNNPLLPFKLGFILLGIVNALLFRAIWSPRLSLWDHAAPVIGRMQAAASLLLWIAAATCGRLLAYV
ncbi:hypothetical protein EKL30_18585 [Candidimonas sp. SYP-B2681]|nr:hypothetical protein EKL30_18585 [Candidimonas sp. SYP-B2681]